MDRRAGDLQQTITETRHDIEEMRASMSEKFGTGSQVMLANKHSSATGWISTMFGRGIRGAA